MEAGVVVAGLILALALFVVFKGVLIVKQAEVIVIERLGRYSKTLGSGLNVIIPFLDSPRDIQWRHLVEDPSQGGRTISVPPARLDLIFAKL